MQGIEVLYWALSILFCMVMGFAILLWCRSWRREEREETARQVKALSGEVGRLTSAVDALEHASASLQTADEGLAGHLEDLRASVNRIRAALVPSTSPASVGPENVRAPEASPDPGPLPPAAQEAGNDRYMQARVLLQQGRPPVDVARMLDIGTAEVRMIARMLDTEGNAETANEGSPQDAQTGRE